jgi:hypothetical protein
MGDAGGFGRVFRGIADFLTVVFLPDPFDRGDGEESTMLTNRTFINSRIVSMRPTGLTGFTGFAGALCLPQGKPDFAAASVAIRQCGAPGT